MIPLPIKILIADDEKNIRELLREGLAAVSTHVAAEVENGELALEQLRNQEYDILLLDLSMPGMTGIEVLKSLREMDISVEVIVLTAHATVQTAVEAMRLGAYDYLMKPFKIAELTPVIEKAYEKKRLRSENALLKAHIRKQSEAPLMVAQSPVMRTILERSRKIAHAEFPVLITGESGTGKELIARFIHNASPRADRSYVVINCGALPETMIESELFGYEKGAFTGAAGRKPGLFEIANEGTLLLDEIGDMPPALQVKVLRVIETGSFYRLGGTREQNVNVRVLSATNKDLKSVIKSGLFREDLFYRISGLTVQLPPLRERKEDIIPLIERCRNDHPDFRQKRFSADALAALCAHDWPGNIRELQNVIHHLLLLTDKELIEPADLPAGLTGRRASSSIRLDDLEREHIFYVLSQCAGDRNKAAEALGIHPRTLLRKLAAFGMTSE